MGAAALRPHGQRVADRRDGAQGRRRSRRRKKRRSCSAEAQRYKEQGADKPFLDVWFADAQNGYRGRRVQPDLSHDATAARRGSRGSTVPIIPKFFNLYAIRPAAGDLFIAGEGGLVLKLDRAAQRFRALADPLQRQLLRRGRRRDLRCRRSGCAATSIAATTAARRGPRSRRACPRRSSAQPRTRRGATMLADAAGRVVASADGGRTFASVPLKQPMPLTGVAEAGDGRLALVGPRGVAVSRKQLAR